MQKIVQTHTCASTKKTKQKMKPVRRSLRLSQIIHAVLKTGQPSADTCLQNYNSTQTRLHIKWHELQPVLNQTALFTTPLWVFHSHCRYDCIPKPLSM